MTIKIDFPKTVIVDDKSIEVSLERIFPCLESITVHSRTLEEYLTWMYYKYTATDVLGIRYIKASDTLIVIKLPSTSTNTINNFMATYREILQVLEANNPEWRNLDIFVFDLKRVKTLYADDFEFEQPDVFGFNSSIILAKVNIATKKADPSKLFFIYSRSGETGQSVFSLLALAKIHFASSMAKSINSNRDFDDRSGKSLAYALILGHFLYKRGYVIAGINSESEYLPALDSVYLEPLFSKTYSFKELDALSETIKKEINKDTAKVQKKDQEEIGLSELVGMGIDAILEKWPANGKPIKITIDAFQDKIKTAILDKVGLILELTTQNVNVGELKELLDSDNITFQYPDGTVEPDPYCDADLLGYPRLPLM